jgi:hypothetical protein
MRIVLRLFALLLATGLAGSAFARELDETRSNTSLSVTPVHTTSASDRAMHRGKADRNVPAKYDVAFPVHDSGRVAMRERGAI